MTSSRTSTNWVAVKAILRKDLLAVYRSKAVVLPMLIVPVVLLVILPASIGLAARNKTLDFGKFFDLLPSTLTKPIFDLPSHEQLVVLVLGYLVAPLFLIVPLMVSAVLAGDAFAGEKERKTLESLLHLPVRDREIYVAKLLVAFIPSVAVSWIGFTIYVFIANTVAWPIMQRIFVPSWRWMALIFWLAPAVAAVGLGVMVRVSIRVNNTQEAQQLGGAVVLPLVLLAVSQTTSLMLAGVGPTLVAGAIVWLIAAWLNIRGAQAFTRDRMAARL